MSARFSAGRLVRIALCFSLIAINGCSGGGPRVSKDSPEYMYGQAKEAVADFKYEKAIDLTGDILRKFSDSEYAEKAGILRAVVLAGLSSAYREMAEAYLAGFEKSFENSGKLRATAFDYFRKQKNAALSFSEACDRFLDTGSAQKSYVLECNFPSREVTYNKKLEEVREGNVLDREQRKAAEENEICDEMLDRLSFFVGAAGDRAKARKLLETGTKTIERSEFLVHLGRTLLDNQKVFGRQALNDVQHYRNIYDKAVKCSETAQEILKDNANPEIQTMADNLKSDLDSMQKQGAKG